MIRRLRVQVFGTFDRVGEVLIADKSAPLGEDLEVPILWRLKIWFFNITIKGRVLARIEE